MTKPPTLRFKLTGTSVLDTLTGERHQFDTYEQAWFGRGRLEREHKAPVVTTARKQKRLAEIAEQRQGGMR